MISLEMTCYSILNRIYYTSFWKWFPSFVTALDLKHSQINLIYTKLKFLRLCKILWGNIKIDFQQKSYSSCLRLYATRCNETIRAKSQVFGSENKEILPHDWAHIFTYSCFRWTWSFQKLDVYENVAPLLPTVATIKLRKKKYCCTNIKRFQNFLKNASP